MTSAPIGNLDTSMPGEALNSIVDTANEPNTMQSSYGIIDGSIGVENYGDGWGVELFVSNLTDERAQLHINRQDFFERVTTNRPRNDRPTSLLRRQLSLIGLAHGRIMAPSLILKP